MKHLLGEMGFKTRRLAKSVTRAPSRNRDAQFQKIETVKRQHVEAGNPIFSVDSKKKESIGRMYRPGEVIANGPVNVLDHDLPSYAEADVTPHGIYDVQRNRLHMTLTAGSDTSEFACASLRRYWFGQGVKAYRDATSLLLLCDCGGSNSNRSKPFKPEFPVDHDSDLPEYNYTLRPESETGQ